MNVTDNNHDGYDGMLQNILHSQIDEIDFEIYQLLNSNGRISDTEICERVELSRTAVRRRRKRLLREGLLTINAQLNLDAFDVKLADVLIQFKPNSTQDERDAFIASLTDKQLVFEVNEYLGDIDIIARVCNQSFHDLKDYVHRVVHDMDIVESYSVVPVTKTHKRSHSPFDANQE